MKTLRPLLARRPGLAGLCLLAIVGCQGDGTNGSRGAPQPQDATGPGETTMQITITSPAFEAGAAIPTRYTGEGDDLSPALHWSGVPTGAAELALIMDDPDAPRAQPWVHWVIYKLPRSLESLPEGVATAATLTEPAGALQGQNSWGSIGYRGPLPPPGHGVHHYHFKLYALDVALDAPPGLSKEALLAKMEGHVLAQGELVGTYQR